MISAALNYIFFYHPLHQQSYKAQLICNCVLSDCLSAPSKVTVPLSQDCASNSSAPQICMSKVKGGHPVFALIVFTWCLNRLIKADFEIWTKKVAVTKP